MADILARNRVSRDRCRSARTDRGGSVDTTTAKPVSNGGRLPAPPQRELVPPPTSTRAILFTPLSAITILPSLVVLILRTTPPPPGMTQVWNFCVAMSNRTRTLGLIADSTYQIAPLR